MNKFSGQYFLFQTYLFRLNNPETFTFQGSPSIKSAMINFYRPNGGRYNPHSKVLPEWFGALFPCLNDHFLDFGGTSEAI